MKGNLLTRWKAHFALLTSRSQVLLRRFTTASGEHEYLRSANLCHASTPVTMLYVGLRCVPPHHRFLPSSPVWRFLVLFQLIGGVLEGNALVKTWAADSCAATGSQIWRRNTGKTIKCTAGLWLGRSRGFFLTHGNCRAGRYPDLLKPYPNPNPYPIPILEP